MHRFYYHVCILNMFNNFFSVDSRVRQHRLVVHIKSSFYLTLVCIRTLSHWDRCDRNTHVTLYTITC